MDLREPPVSDCPDGIALDAEANAIYWTTYWTDTVEHAELDDPQDTRAVDLDGPGNGSANFPALLREPQGTGPPVTSPTGVGDELSCSHGDWAPDLLGAYLYRAPQSFARQWLRDDVEIPGETGATFTPTEPGDYTCRVTATNPAGSSSQTSSSALDVPPAAVDDERTVAEDSSATQLDPLDNDDDGGDGGPVQIASASDPAHGTVALTGGTSGAHTGLTYEPDADYCNDAPANPTDDFTYTLNGGSTATVAVTVTCVVDDSLYWTNKGGGGAVRYMGLNPATGPDDLVGGQGDNGPCGMALDPAAGKAYWAHFADDKIRRADLDDGDAIEDVVTEPPGSEPCGMAIDPVAGRIYWANSATGQIRVADLDPGTDDASNLATGQEAPTGVAIDPVPGNPAAGRIYWTNVGSSTIRFADLDPGTGDAPQTLATGPANGLNAPLGLAIDPVAGDPSAGRAYVANLNSNQILVIDLDPGTNDVAELASGQAGPAGVAIDPVAGDPSAGRAYWANFLGGTLARADLAPGTVTHRRT